MFKVLLSNDDGIAAKGLASLKEKFVDQAETWVVAPMEEQSAKSHSFSMLKPLAIRQISEREFAIGGTPADCVYFAINHLGIDFDYVVSGINHGANLGNDLHYSGTVAAAREACLSGIPSMAVSMQQRKEGEPNFALAAALAFRLVHELPPLRGAFYNLNHPDCDKEPTLRAAGLGRRIYDSTVLVREDLRGRPYCWVGGPFIGVGGAEDTDAVLYSRGFATLTPVRTDLTSESHLEALDGFLKS
jgi:5'-nucleotidase